MTTSLDRTMAGNQLDSDRRSSSTSSSSSLDLNAKTLVRLIIICFLPMSVMSNKSYPSFINSNKQIPTRVLFATGISSEDQLPTCSPMSVCSKIDTYSTPWIEKQCRCPDQQTCSMSLDENDGHTILDKTRLLKTCEPTDSLPTCRFFRDVTWTLTSLPDNRTTQTVHCTCPKSSIAYILKHEAFQTEGGTAYKYLFACSPESRLKCQRKEPCKLFTVRKRQDVEEVNTNSLCQCPRGSRCPRHHSESTVISGTSYPLDHIKTFTGFCYSEYKLDRFNKKSRKKLPKQSLRL